MWREVGRIAPAMIALAVVVLAANYGYGLIHETAHGIVVSMAGGEVCGIYVNPLGLDAYTDYYLADGPVLVAVELAGLIATTAVAGLLAVSGKEIIPAFFALRTAIYTVNYAPGTDISNLYATIGYVTFMISITIFILNLFVLALALRHNATYLKSLFSSLSRGHSPHNSGE